jgi:hypothetical protein
MTAPAMEIDEQDDDTGTVPDVVTETETDAPEPDATAPVVSDDDEDDPYEDAPPDVSAAADSASVADDAPPAPSASTGPAVDATPNHVELRDVNGVYQLRGATFELPKAPGELGYLKFDSPAAIQRTRTLLEKGVQFESTFRRQIEIHEKVLADEVAKAKADADQFLGALWTATDLPYEEFAERMREFWQQAPNLRFQTELAQRDAKIAALEGRKAQQSAETFPEPPAERLNEWRESETMGALQQVAQSGSEPWMDADAVQHLHRAALSPAGLAYFARTATAEDIQRNPGLTLGEPLVDKGRMFEFLAPLAETYRTAHDKIKGAQSNAARTLQSLGQVAKQNRAILEKAGTAATPAAKPVAAAKPSARLSPEAQREAQREAFEREKAELAASLKAQRLSRIAR